MHTLGSRALGSLALSVTLALAGCGDGVQEDRSINHSRDGGAVAFHHGDEGVFVATADGSGLERIYDTADTIAASSPLWSPVDRRLIFTVAQPAETSQPGWGAGGVAWDANPEGRLFRAEPIVYDCLLRQAPKAMGDEEDGAPESPPEPERLFRAKCDHAGYVAANLAVRWHPDGTRVLFVDSVPEGGVSLFEFELASRTSRRVFPRAADALVFDFSLQGGHLCCVLGRRVPSGTEPTDDPAYGVWVRTGDAGDWWRVPNSGRPARTGEVVDVLERLRSMRPAWTADDRRFACVVREADEEASQNVLLEVEVASRTAATRYRTEATIRDMQWRPDGERLGFIESPGGLRLSSPDGTIATPPETEPVRRFAGWNHDGTRLAWIVPEPKADDENWALLFPPVPDARDHVLLADADVSEPPRLVHEGMRITFPQWSPTRDELSLWGTCAPTHRSLLSRFVPWSLQPGDPAAILDGDTGEMHWMAINAREESQVGHYHLLKRDYERAWEWYERSSEKRKPAEPIKLDEMQSFLRGLRIHDDPTFFEYHCLTKLGRDDDAALRLKRYRETMRIDVDALDGTMTWARMIVDVKDDARLRAELIAFANFATPWIRNAHAAEVFLSLGATGDGVVYFRREHETAGSDAERSSTLIALSQMLLVEGDRVAYADVVIDELVPLLLPRIDVDLFSPLPSLREPTLLRRRGEAIITVGGGGIAALPLLSGEFLAGFTAADLESQQARWEAVRAADNGDEQRTTVDLFLLAIHAHRGDRDEWARVRERMTNVSMPGGPPATVAERSAGSSEEFTRNVDELVHQLREPGR